MRRAPLPGLADTAAIDAAIAAANAESATILAEFVRLQGEMVRFDDQIRAHNANARTPKWHAEHDRMRAQRDEFESLARDLISGALEPMTKRLVALNTLRARAVGVPQFTGRSKNAR